MGVQSLLYWGLSSHFPLFLSPAFWSSLVHRWVWGNSGNVRSQLVEGRVRIKGFVNLTVRSYSVDTKILLLASLVDFKIDGFMMSFLLRTVLISIRLVVIRLSFWGKLLPFWLLYYLVGSLDLCVGVRITVYVNDTGDRFWRNFWSTGSPFKSIRSSLRMFNITSSLSTSIDFGS